MYLEIKPVELSESYESLPVSLLFNDNWDLSLNHCPHLMGEEHPPEDLERPSVLTLHSYRAAYEAVKQSGPNRLMKKTRATLLETLHLHGLIEEVNYIAGGEKGKPPNIPDTVPKEVGMEPPYQHTKEAGAAAIYGGGDALPRKTVTWEKQVQMMENDEAQSSKEAPHRELPPPPLWKGATMTLSTDNQGFTLVTRRKSRDKRPWDPSKDPTPRRRPSKAACSPLPFPLRSEAERVSDVHTLFESVTNETGPTVPWLYNNLLKYYPQCVKEQIVYISNVLCITIVEYHLTCGCNPIGMCSPVLPQIIEAELPPLDAYLHEHQVGTRDIRIFSLAIVKGLRVWLHCIDMTVSKKLGKAKADSIHDKDHKIGGLLDYLLMPDTLGISWEDVLA